MASVSVIMPVYNGQSYLVQAIESVRAQTVTDLELIVVDDGSTDQSAAIVKRFIARDHRIRLIRQTHTGISVARNRALQACTAEWVACLDADDVMLPIRLERQLAFASAHPAVAAFGAIALYINSRGTVFGTTVPVAIRSQSELDVFCRTGELIGFNHPSVMMRKSSVLAVGGYHPDMEAGEDLDLWMRLAQAGYLILQQDEILGKYRIHSQSVTHRHAHRSHLTSLWVKARADARRNGFEEPTRREFDTAWQARPLIERMHAARYHLGWVFYRRAGAALSNREMQLWPIGVVLLAIALCLRPLHTSRRLVQQLFATRLNGNFA